MVRQAGDGRVGVGRPAGATLAARVEEIAAVVLSTDPDVQGRLSRHDAVSFIAAASRQMARLEALRSVVMAALTHDAAYHSCDTGWDGDDGTGRACPACAWVPLVEVETEVGPGDDTESDTGDGDESEAVRGTMLAVVPDTETGEPDERWPEPGSGNASPVGQVGLELSAALLASPSFATSLTGQAVDLVENLPATWAALADGAIDVYRARVIAESTRGLVDNTDWSLPEPQLSMEIARRETLRAQVEAAALSKAPMQTGEQVRRRVRRLVLKADPTLARHARAAGVADRQVSQPYTRGDEIAGAGGIGSMTLRGPVEDLHALYAAIDAAARHARDSARDAAEPGGAGAPDGRGRDRDLDRRTLEQFKFDILTGLGWTALRIGHFACCHPDHQNPTDHQSGDHDHAAGDGSTAGDGDPTRADAAAGDGYPAGDRDGYPADDDDTGLQRRGGDAAGGAARNSPWFDAAGSSAAAVGAGPTRLAGRGPRGRPVEIRVTVSLATLLGLNDDPAELAGTGPIPAQVARDLAHCEDATWRRLITDPASGTLLDYGHTTYRPPEGLAAFVRTRDGTCRFLTTITPADACDLDHSEPFDHHDDHDCPGPGCDRPGGVTADHDLGAVSRRPHNARTHHHWQLSQPRPGRFRWVSPAGHVYTVEPDPLDEPEPVDEPALADDPEPVEGPAPVNEPDPVTLIDDELAPF